jgi:hypothetical protein
MRLVWRNWIAPRRNAHLGSRTTAIGAVSQPQDWQLSCVQILARRCVVEAMRILQVLARVICLPTKCLSREERPFVLTTGNSGRF